MLSKHRSVWLFSLLPLLNNKKMAKLPAPRRAKSANAETSDEIRRVCPKIFRVLVSVRRFNQHCFVTWIFRRRADLFAKFLTAIQIQKIRMNEPAMLSATSKKMQLSSLRTQATSPDPGRRFIDCLIGQDSQMNLLSYCDEFAWKASCFLRHHAVRFVRNHTKFQ